MSNIVNISKTEAHPDLATLEGILLDFIKYGRPRLQCMSDMTWYCGIEIFVTGKGIDFKIASDFKQKTALLAAQQCHERMRDSLRDIYDKAKLLP